MRVFPLIPCKQADHRREIAASGFAEHCHPSCREPEFGAVGSDPAGCLGSSWKTIYGRVGCGTCCRALGQGRVWFTRSSLRDAVWCRPCATCSMRSLPDTKVSTARSTSADRGQGVRILQARSRIRFGAGRRMPRRQARSASLLSLKVITMASSKTAVVLSNPHPVLGSTEVFKTFNYAPAVAGGGLLFIAAQIGIRAAGTVPSSVEEQIDLAFQRLGSALRISSSWSAITSISTSSSRCSAVAGLSYRGESR